ncbi:MAG: hypothetical protein ACR2Q3_02330 [Woeseiaceae bacterium]
MRDRADKNIHETDRLAVAALYKQIANEQAPDELNRLVLQEATTEVRNTNKQALSWLRPAVLAATLALSVALVLQVGDMGATKSIPRNLESPATSGQDETVFDAAAAAGMEQLREAESAVRTTPGVSESESESESPFAPRIEVDPKPSPDSEMIDNQGCSVDQRSSTVTWLECIQALEKRGLTDLATRELEALFAANPGIAISE